MAHRIIINNLLTKCIAQKIGSGNIVKMSSKKSRVKKRGNTFAPGREFTNPELIKKNYGIIPLLTLVGVGLFGLISFVLRTAVTRDDVRFHPTGKYGYEDEKNLERQRKFLVFNQKYKTPEGLKEIYEDLAQSEKKK